ncbi:bifunctional GNAT family N-acetyltransferase/NUDIX hydrolase [Saccharibacillus sacchari]|uniref:bifunctional GNAT family N-acetyltransferase/NUDIX hydrolase n=1 Tax=Saccharibacillus sacchari TaxID=456493 RepID=UPI0004B8919E|nr:bifunctional GNAT family N-acetyltransferase/NUDIX hydrolase [Saccharibacillus sacchari]
MSVQKEAKQIVTVSPVQSFQLEELRRIAIAAFAEDLRRYGMMPEGIETIEWHEEGLGDGSYLVIESQQRVAGGARIFDLGDGTFRLGSLFIDPALHGRGIGKQAMEAIERYYPQARTWSLDTPAGSTRNQRFYAHAGYVKVGESYPVQDSDFCLFDYAKPELLVEIRDAELFADRNPDKPADEHGFALRQAARAVLTDGAGRMALMHVAKDGYHKLPGGGIEPGEDVYSALRREMREESGAEIEVTGTIGMTAEYIAEYKLKQFSYAYSAELVGSPGESAFTEEEQAGGFAAMWVKPDEALSLMENDQPKSYSGHFIRCRDLAILRAYLN